MTHIYKILTRGEWAAAKTRGVFHGSGVDLADGFIHFSTAAQAGETARRYFHGQPDLVIVGFEAERLGSELKWEPSRDGDLFPHLYAPLLTDLAVFEAALPLDADGAPVLPALAP